MSGPDVGLGVAVFLAAAVEAVEALTIVLAAGVARGWRSALWGLAAGLACLACIVAALGPAITQVPLGALHIVVGGLLLTFGLQWLRKAILRAAGLKALHDENAIFARERDSAASSGGPLARRRVDSYGFTIAFKGVLLEGLEVAFIVVTFGSGQHRIPLAAAAAVAAILTVAAAGVAVRAPLARVPENTMKFVVGLLLCAFGMFWSAEGAGARWPGGDVALLVIIPALALAAFALTLMLRGEPMPLGGAK